MDSVFVKGITEETDVQEGKIEPIILFQFCVGRNRAMNLKKLWIYPGDFAKLVGINIFTISKLG